MRFEKHAYGGPALIDLTVGAEVALQGPAHLCEELEIFGDEQFMLRHATWHGDQHHAVRASADDC